MFVKIPRPIGTRCRALWRCPECHLSGLCANRGRHIKKALRHPKADESDRHGFRNRIKAQRQAGKTIVYIDESGFAHDMPRTHGYGLRGKRCFGKQDWNAKGRTTVIGALVGSALLTVTLFFLQQRQRCVPCIASGILVYPDPPTGLFAGMCRDLEGGPPEAGLLKLLAPLMMLRSRTWRTSILHICCYLLLQLGLIGFCHSRGHGLWSIFVTVFCVPGATLISIFVFTALFNTAFARGDEFLTLPDGWYGHSPLRFGRQVSDRFSSKRRS